jgi:hypothetical protein
MLLRNPLGRPRYTPCCIVTFWGIGEKHVVSPLMSIILVIPPSLVFPGNFVLLCQNRTKIIHFGRFLCKKSYM